MKKLVIFCFTIVLISACGHEPDSKYLTYQNIVILSDMSNRLEKRPPKDTVEIFKIVDYFRNECVKPGEKIGDKSCISFSAFTQNVVASIDINEIKDLGDKQRFINSTGKYKTSGLDQRIKEFKQAVINTYNAVKDPGLDLISLLIEKIENESLIKENTFLTDGVDTTFINYQNHVYIFTDAYLEYVGKGINDEFYFSNSEINAIRQYCNTNKVDVATALQREKSLGLPSYYREMNQGITLHILETQERDKDTVKHKYDHETGLRDNEILEAVWKKWAKDSGFKDLEWRKY